MFDPTRLRVFLVLAVLSVAPLAAADDPAHPTPTSTQPAPPPKNVGRGVAVVGTSGARDEAFQLARGIYGSAARPADLDEVRARILAGDPPGNASKELRDLGEIRGGITGEDAASRQLLATLCDKLHVQALLVVRTTSPSPPVSDTSAGAEAGAEPAGPRVAARLFLAETGDFDAATYSPQAAEPGVSPWQGTVRSVATRFPAASTVASSPSAVRAPPKMASETHDSRPFWASPWLWAGLGAAALAGIGIFFATRDNSDAPIHLQLRVPR